MPSSDRPNVLVIVAEHVGACADPSRADVPVAMPNLVRLASESVRFDETYCNAPVCGPSRLSLLTGRYVCNNPRGYDNGAVLPSDMPTLAHVLTRGGYQTVISGRMHIHGLDTLHGFERRISSEMINPLPGNPADLPGALAPIRPLPPDPGGPYTPEFNDSPMWKHDDYVTERACDFISGLADSDDTRPFCLLAGYLAAHPGCKAKPELKPLYEHYIRMDLPVPRFTRDDYARLPEHVKRLHQHHRSTERIFSEEFHRHELAWFFARLTYLDQQVGLLLDALEQSGLAKDTVVVFTSDHGDNMGRHGLWGKMNFFQEAQRVPLYARVPGTPPRRVRERVSLVDLLPTLAELAGCEVTYPVDGSSLAPLITADRTEDPNAVVFSEYHGYLSPSDMYMAIKGDHKYCHYLLEPGELYDLARDPDEERNLIDGPAHEATRGELEAEIRQRVDIERFAEEVRDYNAQRQTVAEAMAASPIMQADAAARIDAFRAERDEPWWDGGEYIGRWEGHLKGKAKRGRRR